MAEHLVGWLAVARVEKTVACSVEHWAETMADKSAAEKVDHLAVVTAAWTVVWTAVH